VDYEAVPPLVKYKEIPTQSFANEEDFDRFLAQDTPVIVKTQKTWYVEGRRMNALI
jgi:hypothetical protein